MQHDVDNLFDHFPLFTQGNYVWNVNGKQTYLTINVCIYEGDISDKKTIKTDNLWCSPLKKQCE